MGIDKGNEDGQGNKGKCCNTVRGDLDKNDIISLSCLVYMLLNQKV